MVVLQQAHSVKVEELVIILSNSIQIVKIKDSK